MFYFLLQVFLSQMVNRNGKAEKDTAAGTARDDASEAESEPASTEASVAHASASISSSAPSAAGPVSARPPVAAARPASLSLSAWVAPHGSGFQSEAELRYQLQLAHAQASLLQEQKDALNAKLLTAEAVAATKEAVRRRQKADRERKTLFGELSSLRSRFETLLVATQELHDENVQLRAKLQPSAVLPVTPSPYTAIATPATLNPSSLHPDAPPDSYHATFFGCPGPAATYACGSETGAASWFFYSPGCWSARQVVAS